MRAARITSVNVASLFVRHAEKSLGEEGRMASLSLDSYFSDRRNGGAGLWPTTSSKINYALRATCWSG